MKNKKYYFLLHVLLFLYSMFGIASKLAAMQEFMSIRFFLCYGVVLLNLFLYAICWQQVIKKIPLITAYANKAVTVIWGIVFGYFFFNEGITTAKVLGGILIIIGVYFVVTCEEKEEC